MYLFYTFEYYLSNFGLSYPCQFVIPYLKKRNIIISKLQGVRRQIFYGERVGGDEIEKIGSCEV